MLKNNHKGRYNNDYSPKYSDPYDIYEKAKNHMINLKKSKTATSFDASKPVSDADKKND